MRLAHAQLLPVERTDDLGRKDRFELLSIGVLMLKIAENVSGPPNHFQAGPFH
jgi:hypothetical protein